MSTAIVNEVVGTAWVREADGSLTQIQPGMAIPESATIITENGARVVLGGENTPALTIAGGREFSLAPDVFAQEVDAWGSVIADPTEVAAVDPEAAQVLEALEEGMDPFELLDATAAVAATTTAGGGDNTVISIRTKGGNSAVDQKIILQGVKVADLAADGYESQSDLINSLIDQGKLNVGDI